jgi:hypothetical protein
MGISGGLKQLLLVGRGHKGVFEGQFVRRSASTGAWEGVQEEAQLVRLPKSVPVLELMDALAAIGQRPSSQRRSIMHRSCNIMHCMVFSVD